MLISHKTDLSRRQIVWGVALVLSALASSFCRAATTTVALWLFDEQQGIYPSCVLGDAATGEFPLVIGLGGRIVQGKFGNALEPGAQPTIDWSFFTGETAAEDLKNTDLDEPEEDTFGLEAASEGVGRINWLNAKFCAIMTQGQMHLRQEVGFASSTRSALNLGDRDWTVELWYLPAPLSDQEGVLFEIGTGPRPRGMTTRLSLSADRQTFRLENDPSGADLSIETDGAALASDALLSGDATWRHLAFVYDADAEQVRHYVDGRIQPLPDKCRLRALDASDEDYVSLGRDGSWKRPWQGRLDELRISDGMVYRSDFTPPGSFSRFGADYAPPPLEQGPPLLFGSAKEGEAATKNAAAAPGRDAPTVISLGDRKHLFIDDALAESRQNVRWVVNPPRLAEKVLDGVGGHLVLYQDDDDLLRLYLAGPRQSLAVLTSRDGVDWEAPDLGRDFDGQRNIVIEDPVGLGTLFVDPNAPKAERIKYFSGYRGRGSYVYSSPDGYRFVRNETSALPFRGASQSLVYYDDQRQRYVGFHRSDMLRMPSGKTMRSAVRTETVDLMRPWPFQPVSQRKQAELGRTMRLGNKNPYYIDNGPLTPPGFGVEYPTGFSADEAIDPVGVDVYVPKIVKYPWAPDAYVAFPVMYFHYHGDGPESRRRLGEQSYARGSGPLETQFASSRDGVQWTRYPRPAYLGIGRHAGLELHRAYIAHGMARRGDEIWQYYLGEESYHSPWTKGGGRAVFRVVQRLDGFVSVDSPYEGGVLVTKPFAFEGNRLSLNIDTDAVGYAQIGLLDMEGNEIPGFGLDECVYLNVDSTSATVEWLDKGSDVGELAGTPIKMTVRSRGTKLYSFQFVQVE